MQTSQGMPRPCFLLPYLMMLLDPLRPLSLPPSSSSKKSSFSPCLKGVEGAASLAVQPLHGQATKVTWGEKDQEGGRGEKSTRARKGPAALLCGSGVTLSPRL